MMSGFDSGDNENESVAFTDAMLATLFKETVNARIRTRALIELLEEKGLLVEGEYDEKAQIVWERDYDLLAAELMDQITKG